MEILSHKGYQGSVETSLEDDILHGKILFIQDLVTYEADSLRQLRQAFQDAVDDYLLTCQACHQEPNKPLSGQFNVRVGADLHKRAAIQSVRSDTSLNAVIVAALEAYLNEDGTLRSNVQKVRL